MVCFMLNSKVVILTSFSRRLMLSSTTTANAFTATGDSSRHRLTSNSFELTFNPRMDFGNGAQRAYERRDRIREAAYELRALYRSYSLGAIS